MENYILLDWGSFTLFLLIFMRMSGFIAFNPILARESVPAMFQAGFVFIISAVVFMLQPGRVSLPYSLIEFIVLLLMELVLGMFFSLVMNIFFMIPLLGGSLIDTQMGFGMAQMYDPAAGTSVTVNATFLNSLMTLVFFAANGHHTLIKILMLSGEIVPYGTPELTDEVTFLILELFVLSINLGIKLTMPILAAEMLGQVGMGMLMKTIPQINVFVINIDLKVLVGLGLMYLFMPDMTSFLIESEQRMLMELQRLLGLFT